VIVSWSEPRVTRELSLQDAIPENRSLAAQFAGGTMPWYRAWLCTPVILTRGLVRSILIPRTVTTALPPLVVLILRVTVWSLRLRRRVTELGQPPWSVVPCVVHLKLTLTGVRHQPLALLRLELDSEAVMVGFATDRGVATATAPSAVSEALEAV
jgi:hypothetical protein